MEKIQRHKAIFIRNDEIKDDLIYLIRWKNMNKELEKKYCLNY